MPREDVVEAYLFREMTAAGINCHKFKTPGRRHAPDRICLGRGAVVFFVECKKFGEEPRDGQLREHARLRRMGFEVHVVDTNDQVDALVRRYSCSL